MAALPVASPEPDPALPAVRCEAVRLGFPRAPAVLDDVSFSLAPGSFHFLTGPSGAGKSSLLQLLALSLRPTTGRLELFGRPVGGLGGREQAGLRRRIGVVHQDFRLLEHLSVFDNAALPLLVRPGRLRSWRADVEELLAWVGLGERLDASPAELSGGEKQRLAIARAVVGRPELLLADEPTGSVDPAMALRLLRLFVELNRLGTTVLIATHDEELVARSGRPAFRLDGGRLEGGRVAEDAA